MDGPSLRHDRPQDVTAAAGEPAAMTAVLGLAPVPDAAAHPTPNDPEDLMEDLNPPHRSSRDLLCIGTVGSMLLVFGCLIFALLLCWRLVSHALIGTPDVLLIRVLLSCVAAFIGMGFACLGFGLFLIRARGSFSASGTAAGAGAPTQLATNAPGLVVVVCATVVIGLALQLSWERTVTQGAVTAQAAQVDPSADHVTMPVVSTATGSASPDIELPVASPAPGSPAPADTRTPLPDAHQGD